MSVFILYAHASGMVQISGVVTKEKAAQAWKAAAPYRYYKKVELDDANIYRTLGLRKPQHPNAHWEDINKRLGVVVATQNQLTSTEKDVEVLLRVEEENERGLK